MKSPWTGSYELWEEHKAFSGSRGPLLGMEVALTSCALIIPSVPESLPDDLCHSAFLVQGDSTPSKGVYPIHSAFRTLFVLSQKSVPLWLLSLGSRFTFW